MAQKIAVIVMLVITVLLLGYFFFLVITGGKKEKLPFRNLKAKKEITPEQKAIDRAEKAKEKAELKAALDAKKAEWKAQDKEYDEQVKANIVAFKAEVEECKPRLAEAEAHYKEAKAAFDAFCAENPDVVTEGLDDDEKSEVQLAKEKAEAEYLAVAKEYELLTLKLRIEKDRASLVRKLDRWSKRGGRLRREIFVKRQYYYLVAPYTILFFVFTVVPVLMSLVLSFTYFNLLEFPSFVGWENYKSLFVDDKVFMIAIKNTAILAVITGPVSYIMAFVFAWLINELRPTMRSFMTLIFYAPSISGNVYLVWKLIFSSDNYGYANSLLMQLNIIQEPITWLQNSQYIIWILIIIQLWMSLGVSFLSFIAGLQGVNKELYEAGAIDGIKSRWQELWFITLPQMKSQLMFGAVMQITSALSIAEVSINIAGFPSVEYAGHTIITHLMDY